MADDRFWRLLLAGELSARKARLLAGELAGLPDGEARLLSHPALADAERRRIRSASEGSLGEGRLLLERDYPEALVEAEGPPALYVDGDPAVLAAPCVAIVGTRDASAYGRACAQKFAEGFARAGVTVVSGGALGIDAAAHQGALQAGGKTVAVLAGGVDQVYPAVHAGLFARIREAGCLMGQFPPGSRPDQYKFPLRNDLIAALCAATVVIEAPTKSGALRTAASAADLGREVFAVPATIDNRAYWGSFNLIRDGATFVYHPDQVLESLGIEPVAWNAPAPVSGGSGGDAERVLAALGTEPLPPERIVEATGLDASAVLSELTMLEIDGRVLRHGGGYVVRP